MRAHPALLEQVDRLFQPPRVTGVRLQGPAMEEARGGGPVPTARGAPRHPAARGAAAVAVDVGGVEGGRDWACAAGLLYLRAGARRALAGRHPCAPAAGQGPLPSPAVSGTAARPRRRAGQRRRILGASRCERRLAASGRGAAQRLAAAVAAPPARPLLTPQCGAPLAPCRRTPVADVVPLPFRGAACFNGLRSGITPTDRRE
jgi:hypothetical protein